jgi:hypothetical protein
MRRALTFLTAFVLSLASLAVGVFTADLPFWLRAMQLPRAADQLYLPVAAIGAAGAPPQAAASSVPVSVNAQTVQIDTAALESAVSLARDAGSRACCRRV